MAKQRIVNTRFWDDSYIARLSPTEKLLFLYLITNPLTNIAGVYELPLKRVAFDTGIATDIVDATLKKLQKDGKLVVADGWIGPVNFIKYQTLNPKIRQGILLELKRAPKGITDRLSIDYHPNTNGLPLRQLSTELPEDIQKARKKLITKWRV